MVDLVVTAPALAVQIRPATTTAANALRPPNVARLLEALVPVPIVRPAYALVDFIQQRRELHPPVEAALFPFGDHDATDLRSRRVEFDAQASR